MFNKVRPLRSSNILITQLFMTTLIIVTQSHRRCRVSLDNLWGITAKSGHSCGIHNQWTAWRSEVMCTERLAEKNSLSCWQIFDSAGADWTSSGRLFQSHGPAVEN